MEDDDGIDASVGSKGVRDVLQFKEILPYRNPSSIRISTITSMVVLNQVLDLEKCFEALEAVNEVDVGIVQIKMFAKVHEEVVDDAPAKSRIELKLKTFHGVKEQTVPSCFQNQMTIVLQFMNCARIMQRVNCFAFKKGKIKVAGLRQVEDIQLCADVLVQLLRKYVDSNIAIVEAIPVMYNTDFEVYFRLLRNVLFHIVLQECNLEYSRYDPELYPGVKIKFSCNSDNALKDGVCYCSTKCIGKGRGSGPGNCKIGTISVFQTGKVIITGANTFEQVETMYVFINKLLRENYDRVYFREPFLGPGVTASI